MSAGGGSIKAQTDPHHSHPDRRSPEVALRGGADRPALGKAPRRLTGVDPSETRSVQFDADELTHALLLHGDAVQHVSHFNRPLVVSNDEKL